MKQHLIPETGLRLRRSAGHLEGNADVVPELCVPGTDRLRASVLVPWADVVCGLLTSFAVGPRVPVTLELSLEMCAPVRLHDTVGLSGRVVKAGSAVTHVEVEVRVGGVPAGLGSASFMLAPDATLVLPDADEVLSRFGDGSRRLTVPYTERVDCERARPGIARLPRTQETTNASQTINGGVIALAAEEAVLSSEPAGTVVDAMALRYLRPARVGPAVASAVAFGDLWRVEIRDAGAGDRPCVLATVRTTGPG
jgi:acyl-coenzyme A thioesterase PaaI-like protein